MEKILLRKTMDYDKLVPLFIAGGLEIHEDTPAPEGLITCFELVEERTDRAIGAGGLVCDGGLFILRCIAVDKAYRGRQYGKMLVQAVLTEARKHNAKEVWLTAKIPTFYQKFGFVIVPREDAPHISDCQHCPQFHNGCDSEIMKIDF